MIRSAAFRTSTAAALLSFVTVAHAATPAALVRDVLRTPGPNLSSGPSSMVSLGDRALFWASAPLVGRELYRTDGTTAGTSLITDLCPGSCDSLTFPAHPPIAAAGYAFFLATDGARGTELWRSDGTAAGTRPMIDLAAGPEDGFYLSLIGGGDRVLFATLPPSGGGIDLWQSDGTAAGTAPFVHLADGTASALARHDGAAALGPLPGGQRLYFPDFLVGGNGGVWESDGTAAGTRPVRALPEANRVFCSGRSDLPQVTAGGLVVSFSGPDEGTDCEPWLAADGVARPILDLAPGPEGSFPYGFVRLGSVTLFAATVPGLGEELWRTDGTAAGTFLLGDANPGAESAYPLFLGDLGGEAYYRECDAAAGCELWATNGAAGSLRRVADLTPGPESSDLLPVGVAGGRLWFKELGAAGGSKLWTIDTAGTLDSIATLGAGDDVRTAFAAVGPLAVFGADLGEGLGIELAASDGTAAGTRTLRDLLGREASSFPDQLTRTAGRVLFTATDDAHGTEVWRTDGTTSGTQLVADLTPAGESFDGATFLAPTATGVALQAPDGSIRHARAKSGGIDYLYRPGGEFPSADSGFRLGGRANFFLTAGDFPVATLELWQADGRSTGNAQLAEIKRFNPVVGYQVTVAVAPDSRSAYFLPVNTDGKVGDIADGLWRTDGSASGTRQVVAEPCAPCSGVRAGDAVVGPGGKFFYVVVDIVDRFAQLWVSDGTPAGTKKLLEGPGPLDGGEIRSLARLGSRVIFSGFDFARGQELWVTDGTADGTRRLADLRPGPLSSSPEQLVSVGGRVYFSADDGKAGRELWATNGTPAGTKRVADLRPGSRSSVPQSLTAIGDRLVFAADDGIHGLEVWSSEGTAAGTRLASDVQVGRLPSSPGDFVVLGSDLLFVASRLATGRELFRLPLSALGLP